MKSLHCTFFYKYIMFLFTSWFSARRQRLEQEEASRQRPFGRKLAERHVKALQAFALEWLGMEASNYQVIMFAVRVERDVLANVKVSISDILQKIDDSGDDWLWLLVFEIVLLWQDSIVPDILLKNKVDVDTLPTGRVFDINIARLDTLISVATCMKVNLRPRYCDVCLEDHRADLFPQSPITSTCNHEPDICLPALASHLKVKLEHWPFSKLTCALCPEELSADDMQRWASPETFLR